MRTYIGTLVALDAFIGLPFGNVNRHTAFFIFRGTGGECTILTVIKGRYFHIIAFHEIDRLNDIFNEVRDIPRVLFGPDFNLCPFGRDFNLFHIGTACDGGQVHIYNLFAFAAEGLNNGFLHFRKCALKRYHFGYFEEGGLHDGVRAVAQANAFSNIGGIYNIELNIIPGHVFLYGIGKFILCFLRIPYAVEKKSAAFFQSF